MGVEVAVSSPGALATLAREANRYHREVEQAVASTLDYARQAGEALAEAKARVEHGRWGTWLVENFEGSERTARVYMQVVEGWSLIEEAKRQSSAVLSIDAAVKLLAKPRASSNGAEPQALSNGNNIAATRVAPPQQASIVPEQAHQSAPRNLPDWSDPDADTRGRTQLVEWYSRGRKVRQLLADGSTIEPLSAEDRQSLIEDAGFMIQLATHIQEILSHD